uniref:Citrate transporter-like domain-containing protein n=1 Tax=Musca domestica TaxID=7370 RepID=A0A1I8N1U3_MUSDO
MPLANSSSTSLQDNEEIVIRQIVYHLPDGQPFEAEKENDDDEKDIFQNNNSRHEMRIGGGAELAVYSEEHLSLNEEPEEEPYRLKPISALQRNLRKFLRYLTQGLLMICWLTFTYHLMRYPEREEEMVLLSFPPQMAIIYELPLDLQGVGLAMKLRGLFSRESFQDMKVVASQEAKKSFLSYVLQGSSKDLLKTKNISLVKHLFINENSTSLSLVEKVMEQIIFPETSRKFQLLFRSKSMEDISLELFVTPVESGQTWIIIWGLALLITIYLLMASDLLHRTFAAILCSSLVIGLVAAVHVRPSLEDVFHGMEFDIIMNFFGISLIMEILAEAGLQDYLAAWSYEMANGHIWPLLNVLFPSSILLVLIFDDITLILFLTPIGLRLCEIMHLNCAPVLACLIISINLGCSLTPNSSLSNYLIFQHESLKQENLTYGSFLIHLLPASLLTLLQSYTHLRLLFHNSAQIGTKEPLQVERLRRLTRVWRKVSDRMGAYSLDERSAKDTVDTRIRSLRKRLKRLGKMPDPPSGFEEKVLKLRQNFHLKKIPLLMACLLAILVRFLFVILDQGFQSIQISLGWISVLGALLCLSLCNYEDLEGVLGRIDWATMLFISALFILSKMLEQLGFSEAIGAMLENSLANVETEYRLTLGILAIIGISTGLSLLLSNATLINLLLPVITVLAKNKEVNIPLMPLVWSLALSCSLGANGCLVAGIVNVACTGVASKHGYSITFWDYFKIGFLIMLGNLIIASCYLLLAHVWGQWH